jgi:hypothetical protein
MISFSGTGVQDNPDADIRQSMIEREVDMELAHCFSFQAEWLAEIAGPMLQWLMHKTHTSRIIREIHPSSR